MLLVRAGGNCTFPSSFPSNFLVLRSHFSSSCKYSILRPVQFCSLHNTPSFRSHGNVRLQAQPTSNTSLESTLPIESVAFTSDNEDSKSIKIVLTDVPVEVTVTIQPTLEASFSSHNLVADIITDPSQQSNPFQPVTSTLHELPSQMLQTIEALLPFTHKLSFLESVNHYIISSIPKPQDYDIPPPGAKYPSWDPDSKECDKELLLMERYFRDLWLWMRTFDENYKFDVNFRFKLSLTNSSILQKTCSPI